MGLVEKLSSSETSLREERLQPEPSKVIDNEHFIRAAFAESTGKGFEALFRLYYQPLFSHALRFVYTREKAEDIVCDVFHDFWKSNTYDSMQGTFRSYLYAAVRNRAYTYVRYELKEEKNTTSPESSEHLSEANNPESLIEYDELYQRIDQAILQLPAQCQRVFMLSRFEGKKNKEIATELNLSLKTVEAHMAKALSQLRKAILTITILLQWFS
ncbi:RNA polymerase sigma-70 factor [Siphonobacter sp. BAB-5405]|uniref:RNA polymerase sigma-70 factor n=1 Tax=Siphonobacter sp. BAB-5405 TaxID=1864825 RepID=UPI001E621140|nr:RNA polymerase sigma-70 factor [Siphonobacter sp. BAB-5405]